MKPHALHVPLSDCPFCGKEHDGKCEKWLREAYEVQQIEARIVQLEQRKP